MSLIEAGPLGVEQLNQQPAAGIRGRVLVECGCQRTAALSPFALGLINS